MPDSLAVEIARFVLVNNRSRAQKVTHPSVATSEKSKSSPKNVPDWAKTCFFSAANGVPNSWFNSAKAHWADGHSEVQSVI